MIGFWFLVSDTKEVEKASLCWSISLTGTFWHFWLEEEEWNVNERRNEYWNRLIRNKINTWKYEDTCMMMYESYSMRRPRPNRDDDYLPLDLNSDFDTLDTLHLTPYTLHCTLLRWTSDLWPCLALLLLRIEDWRLENWGLMIRCKPSSDSDLRSWSSWYLSYLPT